MFTFFWNIILQERLSLPYSYKYKFNVLLSKGRLRKKRQVIVLVVSDTVIDFCNGFLDSNVIQIQSEL